MACSKHVLITLQIQLLTIMERIVKTIAII